MIGLTDEEVKKNKELYGTNKLSSENNNTFFKLFLETLGDPIIKILLIALGIKTVFLIQNFDWYETVGIVLAIFIASFISTISEYGSEQAFKKMQEESSKIKTKVIRNGSLKEIDINDVVVKDIIFLETGDKVPADGIIIEGSVSVDESVLTGEAKEKEKTKNSKLFKGTVIYSKSCKMEVTDVGINTMYGKIAKELEERSPESPLKIRLRELAKFISKIGYIGAILVSFAYLFSSIVIDNNFEINKIILSITNFREITYHILYALTLSVTIIVVAVPEGLPMMITLVLSSNMKRMLKNNVLVRKLVGIETSGSLNILFTDKTGTITKGKLEAIKFIDSNLNEYENIYSVKPKLRELLEESIIYNTTSEYSKDSLIGGNSTDRALIQFIGFKKRKYGVVNIVPFDSKNKYMETTIKKDNIVTLIKGAPEKIIPMCDYYYNEYGIKKTLFDKTKINDCIKKYTKQGIRVIGVAIKDKTTSLVGIMLIKDEIKKAAIEGIKLVKKAGIHTVMITGDNKDTAISIGREVNLLDEDSIILTSDEMNKLSDKELSLIIPKLSIVARALPSDKSRLVKVAQSLDLVVGMTGDGVNDAPALKKADVGFSMGSGTEVAKEASDIVILDDNFMSISKAILFGRTIFKSIRKFIIFQLTVNMCAISISIIGPFINVETPITVIQMLWINMVMDTLAGLAFSFEPPLLEYMEELPKEKKEKIVNKYMINEILVSGLYSSILCILFLKCPIFDNIFKTNIMTAFFGLFIFISLVNAFNARTERINIFSNIFKNKIFLFIIILVTLIQIFLIYFGGELFRTTGLSSYELLIVILLSLTIIPIDWLRKYMCKKSLIKCR